MVDEVAFRQRLAESVEYPCAYAKAVLSGCVSCACVARMQIAEREVVCCIRPASRLRCDALHEHLRRAFSFALGRVRTDEPMPHAHEMRIQCGGLRGLQYVLDESSEVANVDALLDAVLARWGDLTELPYSEVIHVAALCYKGRHR
jgi:hypothetical protein